MAKKDYMNKKNKIALLFLLSTKFALAMIVDCAERLPKEIQYIITQKQIGKQWWYCKQTYDIERVYSVSWNEDSTCLATGSVDNKARIFDIKTKQLIACFDHGNWVNSVSWNNNGTCLATGSDDKRARIFDVKTQQSVACFDHGNWLNSVSWNNDSTCLATGSRDKKVRIFDVETRKLVACFDHGDCVNSVNWNNDSTCLATGSDDKKARIFDIKTQQLVACFDHDDWVNAVSWNNNGTCLATGSDNKARIFEWHKNATIAQLVLKYALLTWLLIEKPNKKITTRDQLLLDVAYKCGLTEKYATDIWKTFPKPMQKALWRTMEYRIKKYGKEHGKERLDEQEK